MDITITLTDSQAKALASVVESPQSWVENAVHNRCDIAIAEIYKSEVERMTADPAITSIPADRDAVVLAADIKTVASHQEESEVDLTTLGE